MVFAADDVGQHLVTEHLGAGGVEFSHETDADASHGGFEGNASVEQGESAAANGGHGGGAVRFHNFGGDADGVTEFGAAGDDGLD